MKARSIRLPIAVLVAVVALAATVPMARSARADEPLRSGTIIGGYVIFTAPPACWVTLDCAAWLASNCDPRLASRDPGVFSSIVDVGEFAGTERTLWLSSAWLAGGVEFWSEDCRRLSGFVPREPRLQMSVPAAAGWMTITTGDVALRWELR